MKNESMIFLYSKLLVGVIVALLVAVLPTHKANSSVRATVRATVGVTDELGKLNVYLQSRGIAMNLEGIREHLLMLDNSGHDWTLAEKLIAQLGSERFSNRQSAEKSLTELTVLPIELLREASLGHEVEKAYRAKRILERTIPDQTKTLEKVLRSAELLELSGITEEIVKSVISFPYDRRIVQSAQRTIAVAVTRENINFLSAQMTPETTASVREISIHGLRILKENSLSDRFEFWARNHLLEENIRLEAALALADLGDRRSLSLLLEMMDNGKSPGCRSRSHVALRKLTGQKFKFSAYQDPDVRIKQIEAWKGWITLYGKSAALNFPLQTAGSNAIDELTLVVVTNRNCVILLDDSLQIIWKYQCGYPRSAVRMENGNILIVDYRKNRVVEVDQDKRVVREIPVEFPVFAQPLDNGNILITGNQGKSVEEVNPDGEVVWKFRPIKRSIAQAIRLESGNTLVAETGPRNPMIAEYSADGTCVWNFVVDTDKSLSSIQPLGNNVLISIVGSAIEVNKKRNEIAWRLDREGMRDAYRLENGNTLLYANDCVREVDPKGQQQWSKNMNREGRKQDSQDLKSYGKVQQ